MRFFLMALIIFILMKIARKKAPGPVIIWSSIICISIVFGLGHLPVTSAFADINAFVVTRAIVLNGIGGIVFGWLYWKKGLEAAIISHFSADVILHFLIPLILL